MKEVSCRFFESPLRDLEERGIDARLLVEGTAYGVEHVRDKDERVEWSALVRMLQNARSLWTREQLVQLGERSVEGPFVQFIGVVARIRFSVAGFYQWVTAPDGVASQMITCVKTSSHTEGPGRVVVDFAMEPGYEPCEEFFLITQGTYAAMPRMLGAPRADVNMSRTSNGVRFSIQFTESRGVIAGLRRLVTAPFNMKEAALELADAHSSLERRYADLDTARGQIARQNELLDAAYQLSQQIASERDLAAIARAVTMSLVGRVGVGGARMEVIGPHGALAEHGVMVGPYSTVELRCSVNAVLELWDSTDEPRVRALLELITPTIKLALDNAVAYRELADYQSGLERLVDERTRELTTARDKLTTMVDELRIAQESRERFFGNISHEIRTPLTLILLAAGDVQLRLEQVLDVRSREGLVSITESAHKLVRLVDELLVLAAGQADKLKLAVESTDLAKLVQQVGAAWRPAAEQAGLELVVRAAAATEASVDPVAIERVLSNLISNAVKYTPRGGSIEVELALETASDHGEDVRVSVLDTGPGIDADLAQRLFGRFERGALAERSVAGTGIGLALVKQLVEAHGGSVDARPRSPHGTEFRVVLPRVADATRSSRRAIDLPPPSPIEVPVVGRAAEAARLAMPHPEIASGTVLVPSGLSRGVVLIAEDEPRLAAAIAELLANDGYTVVIALDGIAALDLVAKHQPQLLVTDVDMPGMTGIELASKFREITRDRVAPIIILSAMIDLGTRIAGLEAGAVDYISKPFDPPELRARVAAQFRMRELVMRLHRAEQLASMGILTSGLAHELRNPANGIINAIAPLAELLPPALTGPDTDAGQLLDAMKTSAEQIAFLVRQLLGFRAKSELELRPAEVGPLVQRAVALAKPSLQGVDIQVDLTVDKRAMCAAPLLVQVLANLIENAGHAAGRRGWVAIRGTSLGDRITLEVTDSGPGVPANLRERIFEPFFTTKDPGRGTGLGLSVARTILHRHRGTLEVRDRDGKTAFVVDLPGESVLATHADAV